METFPTVISQEELVPDDFKTRVLQIISLNESTVDKTFLPSMKVIPQDENYQESTQTLLQEYFGECSFDNSDMENTSPCDNLIDEYFGQISEDESDASFNFTDSSDEFSDQEEEILDQEEMSKQKDDDNDLTESNFDWGICISCDQKECCICFETKLVFTPSCCGEKQDICLDCIWNIIKQKIPKRQQLDNNTIEKYLLSEFTCCFCREKTKINIHIPSMFPLLFSNFCKSILYIQKPKKKRGRPKKNTSRRGRPRRQ